MKTANSSLTISVALCTYNGARYLQEQLDSIAAQTRLPDELVICDDCSTDNTASVIEEFAANAPFALRLHRNEENLGSTRNFEKAIGLCSSDIIALSDQDDVWHPEKLGRFEEALSARPNVGMVFSDLEVVDENLNPLGYSAWRSVRFTSPRQRLFKKRPLNVLLQHNVVTGCAMAFRAKWRDVIRPIPNIRATNEVHHDYWIALMICAVSGAASINIPLVKYRQHSNQQIGLPRPAPVSESQRLTRWLRKRHHELQPILLEGLKRQLGALSEGERYKDLVRDLEKRQAHLQRRRRTKELRFVGRSLSTLRELTTLRYFRYSEGWSDVVRDVIPARVVSLCVKMYSRQWFRTASAYLYSRRNDRNYVQEATS